MGDSSGHLDLNNLTCRVCLENFDNSNSLYDFVEYEVKMELKDVLKRVTNVEVTIQQSLFLVQFFNILGRFCL